MFRNSKFVFKGIIFDVLITNLLDEIMLLPQKLDQQTAFSRVVVLQGSYQSSVVIHKLIVVSAWREICNTEIGSRSGSKRGTMFFGEHSASTTRRFFEVFVCIVYLFSLEFRIMKPWGHPHIKVMGVIIIPFRG